MKLLIWLTTPKVLLGILLLSLISCKYPKKSINPNQLVSIEGQYALLNTYNVCPENDEGSQLAYTVLTGIPTPEKRSAIAEIWIANVGKLQKPYKITDVKSASSHDGANIIWIGNEMVSFRTGEDIIRGRVFNVKSKMLTKELDFAITDYNSINKLGIGDAVDKFKVYDFSKNEYRDLITREQLGQFKDSMNGSDNFNDWWISDARWAPDGKHYSFHVTTKGTETSSRYIFTADSDGKDIRFFGLKPMHDGWYDNNSLFGHDDQYNDDNPNDNTLRVWDRDRNCIIKKLAPPGCHVGVSPNHKWVASETWYETKPVIFTLYEIGNLDNKKVLMTSPYVNTIWKLRTHVNPAFSKDGKRIYYNRANSDNENQIYRYIIQSQNE